MRRPEVAAGVVLMLLSALIAYSALDFPLYSKRSVGPGFVSFWSALLLFAVSASLTVTGLTRSAQPKDERPGRAGTELHGGLRPILAVLLLLTLYVYCLEWAGFLVCTIVLLWVLYGLWGNMRWQASLLVAFLLGGGSYAIFGALLGVPLPQGALVPAMGRLLSGLGSGVFQ